MIKVLFYIAQEYYWSGLQPVYERFAEDKNIDLYVKIGKNQERKFKIFLKSRKSEIENRFRKEGYKIISETDGFDVVFSGAQIKNPERFGEALLCNLDHGPGIKTLRYRHLLKQKNVKYILFVEGKYRIEKMQKYGLDKIHEIYDTGLPKLDRFFNGYFKKEDIIRELNLDPLKKTVLYAPSYKPTSIFDIGHRLADLQDEYNVIVKLHPYSWSGKYASHKQHRFMEKLAAKHSGIHLIGPEKHDIMPYMFIADTMISDGSSVINEFLALERCGIIVDLPEENLKHRDGQSLLEDPGSEWLKNSFIHLKPEDDLAEAVKMALHPDEKRKKHLKKDKNYIFSYTDGKAAERVRDITLKILSGRSVNG